MATEEMNRVIAEYDTFIRVWNYNQSWDSLMAIWRDVFQELRVLKCTGDKEWQRSFFITRIKGEICEVNIKEAHRLIYEAIVWLNTNKPAQ